MIWLTKIVSVTPLVLVFLLNLRLSESFVMNVFDSVGLHVLLTIMDGDDTNLMRSFRSQAALFFLQREYF
jgi:hypothetical protein